MAGEGHLKRILIAAGCYADAESALALAERLEAGLISEISGMMFEDRAAMESFAKGGGTIVSRGGAILSAPGIEAIRNVFAGDARAFRNRLKMYAETHGKRWSFESRNGEIIGGLYAAASECDWLLIGQSRISRHGGKIIVIAPNAASRSDAADITSALSRSLDAEATWLNPSLEEATILKRVDAVNATLVLVDTASGPAWSSAQLKRLLSVARCPVMILSASSSGKRSGQAPQLAAPVTPQA